MRAAFTAALDDCLDRMATGEASLEECLARYPEYASALRPLLVVALEIRRMPRDEQRAQAVQASRERMLRTLAASATGSLSQPSARGRVRLRALGRAVGSARVTMAAGPLLAVVTLAATVVLALLLRLWLGSMVAQAATLSSATGRVECWQPSTQAWVPAAVGEQIGPGARLRTGEASTATLTFRNGSLARLDSGTELTLVQISKRRMGPCTRVILDQTLGQSRYSVTRLPSPRSCFKVGTPAALLEVQGTDFLVVVDETGVTDVTVISGTLRISAGETTTALGAGQRTTMHPQRVGTPAGP